MMDIVERLRDVTSQTLTSECHQAADEIEQLRGLLKEMSLDTNSYLWKERAAFLHDKAMELREAIEKMRLCSLNRDWKTFDEISLRALGDD
jgi:hypothetical protein